MKRKLETGGGDEEIGGRFSLRHIFEHIYAIVYAAATNSTEGTATIFLSG